MTITCPSCGTRYRPPVAAVESAVNCSCSRCEAVFPSDAKPPSYSVHRAGPAERIAGGYAGEAVLAVSARLEAETPAVAAPAVPAAGSLADFPIGMDDPTLEPKIRGRQQVSEVGTAAVAFSSFTDDGPAAAVDEPEPAVEPEKPQAEAVQDTRPGFGAFMMVTGLPTVLAAGAWQLSTRFGEDPMIWTTPAGVLGLLFSWLWVRWKYRER